METLEFSQDELKYLLASINHLTKTGQIQTGDVLVLAPIIKKIDEKIIKTSVEVKTVEQAN